MISEAVAALICSPLFGYILDVSGTRQGPYLAGIVLLFASMVIFTAASSILWYLIARILQGAATAMVTVAGFAIVTDSVDKRHLGQMLGYIGTAMTLGFVSGPVLGGVVYSVGGFYSAFGMAFAIIAIDLTLRLAVIEKKVAEQWVPESNQGVGSFCGEDDSWNHCYGSTQIRARTPKSSRLERSFALFKLLRQTRILIALWAIVVSAIVASAFDAVSLHNNWQRCAIADYCP